jgi:hypothetical protein
MDAERCQGRPVSGPTGRSRADTGDRQAEYVGRPGRDPLRGRQLSFGWSTVRRRHGRVDAVSAAFAGPGDKDTWGEGGDACGTGLACQTGEAHGTEHIPGERVLRIQVAPTESGRKPGYAAAVDLAAGRSHQRPTRTDAHGRTNVSLARRQADPLSTGKTWRGEEVILRGGNPVPKRKDRRRCVDSGFEQRRISRCRRNGQGSR